MKEYLPTGDIEQPAWSHQLMTSYWRKALNHPTEPTPASVAQASEPPHLT